MKLELYHREACPFSAKVRDFISEEDLESKIEYHDVEDDQEALDTLMELTDDEQVPCLVIDGNPLLESDEIIEWLSKNKSKIT